jgi:trimeric autotransporter adhesin
MPVLTRNLRVLAYVGCSLLLLVRGTHSQSLITTFAGTSWAFPASTMPALSAPLGAPTGVALDSLGDIYVADSDNNLVLKVSTNGSIKVVAGNGLGGFSGDGGIGTDASLNSPAGIALDSLGNLYIADSGNNRIRQVKTNGEITTVAGGGTGGDGGPATNAALSMPLSVAVDLSGNLYIADTANNRIRIVMPSGYLTTYAGNGSSGYSGDGGSALQAQINFPTGVALDANGNLYITDSNNGCIRRVTPNGTIATIATVPGTGVATVDSTGVLYVPEAGIYGYEQVVRVALDGSITLLAGSGNPGFSGDGGQASAALLDLSYESSVAVDRAGNVYIADTNNGRLREVTNGVIHTVAGNGAYSFSGDGARAGSAVFRNPAGLAEDASGNLYIADRSNNRIRKVAADGQVSTVAGNGSAGFSGDGGAATSASLNRPSGVTTDAVGNLYVADSGNNRIRQVTSTGIITTIAGNGVSNCLYTAEQGVATNVILTDPIGVQSTPSGVVYVLSDCANSGIRTVTPSGMIANVSNSQSAYPSAMALDSSGNVYVGGFFSPIQRVTPSGVISSIGSNFIAPAAITIDTQQNLYVADLDYRLYKMTPAGVKSVLAGTGVAGFSGDGGLATAAQLDNPAGLALDISGDIFISDNGRIREILANPPAVQISTTSLTFTGQALGAPTPSQSFNISSVAGLAFSTAVSTTSGNWLSVTPTSGAAPRLIDVIADPSQLSFPGTYTATISISTPNATPAVSTVTVSFTVSAAQAPTLAPLDPQNLSFAFAKSTPAQSQTLTVSNAGGGTLQFNASATVATPAGVNWLTLSQTSGQATPGVPAVLTVTADPTGLGPGTFTGVLTVTAGAAALSIPVTITISALSQAILLSQRGLFFTAVAQGGVVPPQTFAVINIGTGVVAWTAKAIPPATINGIVSSASWLSVSPASGSTDAAQSPPSVTVSVNPSLLAEGTYYGLVEVDALTAANSPQVLTVVLQVLAPGANAAAVLAPGSLLFSTSAGASSPGSQNVLVYNIAAKAKSFQSAVSADPGLSLVILPADATLDPQNPTSIVVQPFTNALGPGVYTGTVTFAFDDGRVIRLTVKVIVSATGASSAANLRGTTARVRDATSAACTPTKLQPILTAPDDAFEGFTGFGVKLGVFVEDDCGIPLQAGSVQVNFSNGDTTSVLSPLQGGLWEGTWYTQNPSPNVNLLIQASNLQGISGSLQTNGSLASQTPPVFDASGIFSAFGGNQFSSLAPGAVISIYGSALADASLVAPGFPLPDTLVDTLVTIQGIPLPLYYVGQTQVNAIVPYSLSITSLNAPLQMLVQRGAILSQPVYVNVAAAEPVLLGSPGAVMDYPSNYPASPSYTVSGSTPAHAGDTLSIYCLGLGTVNPPVPDGTVPTGISNAALVQMSIGNQTATVDYQVLSPQFPGLYQVAVVIPANVAPAGGAPVKVPITVSSGGQTSPPIMILIQNP